MMESSSIKGDYGLYQTVTTKDGSQSLWSEAFDETCHSVDGAEAETDLYYVQGCQVVERFPTLATFSLLEVGFGAGLGYDRTVKALLAGDAVHGQGHLFYVALERDGAMVQGCQQLFASPESGPFPSRAQLRPGTKWGLPCLEAAGPRGTLIVLIGDARLTLPALFAFSPAEIPLFHAVYQDAFSPRKNPALWTVEWFSDISRLAHRDCLLTSFSASSRVRKGLLAAGWKVDMGPRFGPKRASTKAFLTGTSGPSLLEKLARSPVSPITDRELSL